MTSIPQRDPQELLQHEPFVRELARLLVGDRQQAEDLAQDAWLAALEAGPAAMHTPRGWLTTVLRRLAGKQRRAVKRRRDREDFAAGQQPDRAPSVDELLQREHARAAVVKAVLALPDAYRDVVVLRWFEGLPPRDVAKRLGVPVETVRTRHRRAFDLLRQELDAQHGGDRAAWFAALVPLTDAARGTGAVTTTTLLGGMLMLSTKGKLLAAAAALVLVGLLTWTMSPPMTPPPPSHGGAGAPMAAAADTAEHESPSAAIGTNTHQRTAIVTAEPAADPAPTGTTIVRVVWHDGTPAAHVMVSLRGKTFLRSAYTDPEGTARFAELAPGAYLTNIERGSYDVEQPRFEVAAGRETTVVLTVGEALLATGIVVDGHGAPIAGARILVTSKGSSSPVEVARSGADGRFAARDIGCWCQMHASADGLAPSMEHEITGSVGASVELRFVLDRAGGEVAGTVLGPDRQPLVDAWVVMRGADRHVVLPEDGTSGKQPGYAPCATDERGAFSFSSVAPGEYSLTVVGGPCARIERTVTVVAGRTTQVELALLAGATVRGVARDGRGVPVAGASIEVLADGHFRAQTAHDGSYEVVNLPPGELRLAAGTSSPAATLTVQALPGEVVRWDPVLAQTVTLRGRVVDREGRAANDCRVVAHHFADGSGHWHEWASSDADGRFRLDHCEPQVPLFLRVTLPGSNVEVVHLSGVLPGDEELLVTLPPPTAVHLRGTIVDENDRPLPNVQMFVFDRQQRLVLEQNRADGTFEFGPFPAGDYCLDLFRDRSKMRVPFHTIADGETWDLGRLQVPRGGRARVTLVGEGARNERDLTLSYPDGEYAWSDLCRDSAAVIGPIAPGDYLLHVRGADICNQVLPVTIRNGRDTVIDVPVHQGTSVTMPFQMAEGCPNPLELRVAITDATTGARLLDTSIWDRQGLTLRTMLPPGRYRVETRGDNKLQQTMECAFDLDVGSDAIERTVQLSRRD